MTDQDSWFRRGMVRDRATEGELLDAKQSLRVDRDE